jgi:hypothetical protein
MMYESVFECKWEGTELGLRVKKKGKWEVARKYQARSQFVYTFGGGQNSRVKHNIDNLLRYNHNHPLVLISTFEIRLWFRVNQFILSFKVRPPRGRIT